MDGVKQIPLDALCVGMYVVQLDRPWPEHSQLAKRHRITCREDITRLKEHGVHHVVIDPTLGDDVAKFPPAGEPRQLDPLARELAMAQAVRAEAMTVLQGVFEGVKTGTPINSAEVKKTVRCIMNTIVRLHDPLLGLIHMQRNDANMFEHAMNVCAFALVVGKSQGYDRIQLERLGVGAMLHDVGELRLPRNLLQKRGVYTDQERRLMQQHPRLGAAILSHSSDVHEESRRIALEHHERIDGSGYPDGLRGLAISPFSEIVAIVDMYDGMITSRRGRPPLPPARAIKEIYQYGLQGHIDRHWAERVIRCLGIYPVGSLVELSTGERGFVVAANPLDALRPSVRIVSDAAQQPCPTAMTVDLAVPTPNGPERTILRALDPDNEIASITDYLAESS